MNDLKLIKEKYGEEMMHFCRDNFSGILETPGLLFNLLSSKFAYSKFLYDDIIDEDKQNDFITYIFSIFDIKEELIKTSKTPEVLLNEVGYNLYECKSEEDIQKFKKYYEPGEELCTFKGGRLNKCYVFFAVSKNVDNINRCDFKNPKRQDEYGTSVMSIQFTRGKINILSIKNRYNHTVDNPDATFSNNLENITPGLTESFEAKYGFNIKYNDNPGCFELKGYTIASDGRFYKYNYEIDNIYYCPNNFIIDYSNFIIDHSEVKQYNPQEYLIIDYFIIDFKNKTIKQYDEEFNPYPDSFASSLQDIKKIEIKKNTNGKEIIITPHTGTDIIIGINNLNQIISYENNNVVKIGDDFLKYNKTLFYLNMSKVKQIGHGFLSHNISIQECYLHSVEKIDYYFLVTNDSLISLDLPKAQFVGVNFLDENFVLEYLNMPELDDFSHLSHHLRDVIKKSKEKKLELVKK